MIEKRFAERFAAEWVEAWNSRDLDRVLSHYTDDFEMASPFIARVVGEPSGILRGKQAVAAYWARALAGLPDLAFTLDAVHWGVESIVLHYHREDGSTAAEWFELGADTKVVRSAAHYAR